MPDAKQFFEDPLHYFIGFIGEPGCIAADTHIAFQVHKPDGALVNSKGGSIEKLYRRFHNKQTPRELVHPLTEDAFLTAPSMNAEYEIVQNKIVGVVASGVKECFRLTTTEGLTIEATADHKFFTGDQYVPLSGLRHWDVVFVHTGVVPRTSTGKPKRPRKLFYVKQHPHVRTKTIQGKYVGVKRNYQYKVLPRSRAVLEAALNNLTLEDFLGVLNTDTPLNGTKFLPANIEVHHKNEDTLDDSFDNLEALTTAEHSRRHALQNPRFKFQALPAKVESIVPIGQRMTYDLQMKAPYHNFVANNFVVHNSGKTRQAISFPRVYFVEIGDTYGLKTILEDPKNAKFRDNLVHYASLDLEDKKEAKDIFAVTNDPKRLDSIYGVMAHVKALAQEKAIETLVLDGGSFLFDFKGAQIGKTTGSSSSDDKWAYYRQLKEDLTWFVNANVMPLVSRHNLNVIINFHIQRESEEAKAKQTSRDADMSPRIEGSFRQAMSALPRAMIYLYQSVEMRGTEQKLKYSAFCQRVKVPHVGLVPAKNSYGLPPLIDITDKNLYNILTETMNKGKVAATK